MGRDDLPEGIDLITDAVHAADALLREIAEHEALVASKRNDLAEAEKTLLTVRSGHPAAVGHLRRLVAQGACTVENGCSHALESEVVDFGPSAHAGPAPLITLENAKIPIVWRIAFALLANPVLDYQETARRLYGVTTPTIAKNRINGHVTRLRNLGVAETLGSNRFAIDRARLAELSGLSTEEVPNR